MSNPDCGEDKDLCISFIESNWADHGRLVTCPECKRIYRLWGDETYNEETEECFDWWCLTDPEVDENPW